MAVTSRATLTEYCLRALGEPVVEVNVDDSQLEERIDEALDYWNQYHFDGAERMYLKQRITASTIKITTSDSASWPVGTKITGSTSKATASVCSESGKTADPYVIICKNVTLANDETTQHHVFNATNTAAFIPGETITGDNGLSAVIHADGATLGTYDLKYFPIPDYIYGITRVIPFNADSCPCCPCKPRPAPYC